MTMKPVYCAGVTPALNSAAAFLSGQGIAVEHSPLWSTGHLLLDVPSFRPGGWNRQALDTLLASLPADITIWGGNIRIEGYRCVDLLQDEGYLWENGAITARCTLKLASPLLKKDWKDASVLILGWGRIGTHLGKLLKDLGADVAIAARKETDRLRLEALGYRAVDFGTPVTGCDLVVNTVPRPLYRASDFEESCLLMDLASEKGIDGDRVLWARGLPGIHAPEESGALIAKTFLRLVKGDLI